MTERPSAENDAPYSWPDPAEQEAWRLAHPATTKAIAKIARGLPADIERARRLDARVIPPDEDR
jgi:hypothetical protein